MRQIDTWLDGFKLDIKRACALHLRTRTERMNNTNAHTTIHNPYGIAGVRSSTIHEKVNIIIYTLIWNCEGPKALAWIAWWCYRNPTKVWFLAASQVFPSALFSALSRLTPKMFCNHKLSINLLLCKKDWIRRHIRLCTILCRQLRPTSRIGALSLSSNWRKLSFACSMKFARCNRKSGKSTGLTTSGVKKKLSHSVLGNVIEISRCKERNIQNTMQNNAWILCPKAGQFQNSMQTWFHRSWKVFLSQ